MASRTWNRTFANGIAAERAARDLQVPTPHQWERDDMTEQTFVTNNTSFVKEPNAPQAKRVPENIGRGRGRGTARAAKRGTRGRGT
ncbi:DASH complex subunit DAM1 [Neolecta irregularis DAH-3]|uniref:DASH complex subunit DAM1 n=1 Tax=Neolecta irregularis (strain DAH-3) TaxID=1198029 RepID=A0A1U7LTP3_NEOID|nr:DASH complex subunit DAM1 [Neolecta irregularis DAH-3]|eukprot:OLL25953.1 DASH complex subunit DAM1 [Neolecta irregularis DAH-3]